MWVVGQKAVLEAHTYMTVEGGGGEQNTINSPTFNDSTRCEKRKCSSGLGRAGNDKNYIRSIFMVLFLFKTLKTKRSLSISPQA